MRVEDLFWIGFVGGGAALVFALVQLIRVLRLGSGNERMRRTASALRKGCNALLLRQYLILAGLLAVAFMLLLLSVRAGLLDSPFLPYAFLSGALCSALAGFLGAKVTVTGAVRTSGCVRQGLAQGMSASWASSSSSAFLAVGLAVLHVTGWFFFLHSYENCDAALLARTMVLFGLGWSFAALFSQVAGGILAKAVDMASPRSATAEREQSPLTETVSRVLGDLAFHAGGLTAGMTQSYTALLLTALALGEAGFEGEGMAWHTMLLPMAVTAVGALCALLGALLVRVEERHSLLNLLRRGSGVAILLTALFCAPISFLLTGSFLFYLPILAGLVVGVGISLLSELSNGRQPVERLSGSEEQGILSLLLGGIATGGTCTAGTILLLALAAAVAFRAVSGPELEPLKGLYGVALAGVGMLSTLGFPLAGGIYRPVVAGAGEVAELSTLGGEVRSRLDILDALGGVSASSVRGLSLGGGAFASLTLIGCCFFLLTPSLPLLAAGALLGGAFPFLFLLLFLGAVRRSAAALSARRPSRRETQESPEARQDAECAAYMNQGSRGSLTGTALPALLTLLFPAAAALLLGPSAGVGAALGFGVLGLTLAMLLTHTGNAWEGYRQYIESGHDGGRGSRAHYAALLADSLGQPMRDAAGSALVTLSVLCAAMAALMASLA